MPKLTKTEIKILIEQLEALRTSIEEFKAANKSKLSDEEKMKMNDGLEKIGSSIDKLLTQSIAITHDNAKASIKKLKDVTAAIEKNLKTLNNIKKGIQVATAAVTLAAAVISKDPQAIIEAISGLAESWSDDDE